MNVAHADGELLQYPSTGERCVYFPGIEKRLPGFGFYVEDETGRIRVDASGAVLLSEKRLLLPDDEVRSIHMNPTSTPQTVIDRWAGEAGPGDAIRFIDDASRLFVRGLGPDSVVGEP